MNNHSSLSDHEFEKQFKNTTLDPQLFSHEAHLRLAWIHIQKYGREQAIINICQQLQNFVATLGAQNKYNHTLTIAAIKAVYHFNEKSKANNFSQFILEFPRLKYNFKDLMAAHYQKDIYHSKKAKTIFLEPDLIPFDF